MAKEKLIVKVESDSNVFEQEIPFINKDIKKSILSYYNILGDGYFIRDWRIENE